MLFKDIKAGNFIHILDRQTMDLSVAKVTNVSLPHLDPHFSSTSMVVDITIDNNGRTATYTMQDSIGVTYAGNLIISVNKENIKQEIQIIKSQSEEALAKMDWHKTAIDKCDKLMESLDDNFKAKMEAEEKYKRLENELKEIKMLLSSKIK